MNPTKGRWLSVIVGVLLGIVVIGGIFFPRRHEQYSVSRVGPVTRLGESFDAGFIEVEVGSITFDDPQTDSGIGPPIPLPSHLAEGQVVSVRGYWNTTVPWWRHQAPTPPPVVTLSSIQRVRS